MKNKRKKLDTWFESISHIENDLATKTNKNSIHQQAVVGNNTVRRIDRYEIR